MFGLCTNNFDAPLAFQSADGMDKKIILSMGLPMVVRNLDGKKATIELNDNECVVCRFHPENSVYLGDAQLKIGIR